MKFQHTHDGVNKARKYLQDNNLIKNYYILKKLNKFYSIVGFANKKYKERSES